MDCRVVLLSPSELPPWPYLQKLYPQAAEVASYAVMFGPSDEVDSVSARLTGGGPETPLERVAVQVSGPWLWEHAHRIIPNDSDELSVVLWVSARSAVSVREELEGLGVALPRLADVNRAEGNPEHRGSAFPNPDCWTDADAQRFRDTPLADVEPHYGWRKWGFAGWERALSEAGVAVDERIAFALRTRPGDYRFFLASVGTLSELGDRLAAIEFEDPLEENNRRHELTKAWLAFLEDPLPNRDTVAELTAWLARADVRGNTMRIVLEADPPRFIEAAEAWAAGHPEDGWGAFQLARIRWKEMGGRQPDFVAAWRPYRDQLLDAGDLSKLQTALEWIERDLPGEVDAAVDLVAGRDDLVREIEEIEMRWWRRKLRRRRRRR